MNEDWLHKIHDRMSDYETDAPPGLWDEIEHHIASSHSPRSATPRRVMPVWIRRSMAIAAMLAIAITLYLSIPDSGINLSQQEMLSADAPKAITADTHGPEPTAPHRATTPVQVQKHKHTAATISTHTKATPAAAYAAVDRPTSADNACDNLTESTAATDSRNSVPSDTAQQAAPTRRRQPHHTSGYSGKRETATATIRRHATPASRMSIAMYSSGGTGAASGNRAAGFASASTTLGADNTSWKDRPMLAMLLFNRGKQLDKEVSHRLPVRAGVAFTFGINDRISLESGISYANLTSDIKEGSDYSYYTGRQRLHYIGIPANIKYRVYSWRRLDFYTSAGVLAEKCVSATIDKHYIFDRIDNGSTTERLAEKPFQWSVNASAGIQLRLLEAASVYVEPGLSYYFDDGTSIATIYKDKPLNFNLNLGLRFTFGK